MQPGMDPRACRVGQVLAGIMCLIPTAGSRQPQHPLRRRQAGRGRGVGSGGAGKIGGCHDGQNSSQSRLPLSFLLPVMNKLFFLLILPFVAVPLPAGELPQLTKQPWLGKYSGYEHRSFLFSVGTSGEAVLLATGEKGKPMGSSTAIRFQPLIEETLPDGRKVGRVGTKGGWEAVTPAAADPEKVVYRGTVAGGARFEVTFEFDGAEIRGGGKVIEKGNLTNPHAFVLRILFPDVYYYEKDDGKKKLKAKKDRVDLLWTNGKKLKLDLVTPLDAESDKFNGPGVAQARVDLEGYQGNRFDLEAGDHARFQFWNKAEGELLDGFAFGWTADTAKDPDGKGRFVLKVR